MRHGQRFPTHFEWTPCDRNSIIKRFFLKICKIDIWISNQSAEIRYSGRSRDFKALKFVSKLRIYKSNPPIIASRSTLFTSLRTSAVRHICPKCIEFVGVDSNVWMVDINIIKYNQMTLLWPLKSMNLEDKKLKKWVFVLFCLFTEWTFYSNNFLPNWRRDNIISWCIESIINWGTNIII